MCKCACLWKRDVEDYGCKKLYKFQTHTYFKESTVYVHVHVGTHTCSRCRHVYVAYLNWQAALVNCAGEKRGTGQTPVIFSINFLTSIYKAWYSSVLRFPLLLTCFRSQIQLQAWCLACNVDLFVLFIFSIFEGAVSKPLTNQIMHLLRTGILVPYIIPLKFYFWILPINANITFIYFNFSTYNWKILFLQARNVHTFDSLGLYTCFLI